MKKPISHTQNQMTEDQSQLFVISYSDIFARMIELKKIKENK